jgi:Right handed beta helix region
MNISVYQRSVFLGQTTRQLLFILALLACVTVCTPVAYAQMLPPSAPPLPAPTGQVISVSTVSELQAAVNGLASGQTILIQPGTYRLTQELRFRFGVTNVALRGATNNRDDVVILGSGMGTKGVNIAVKVEDAQDVLLANFSVGQAYWHPIQLKGEMGAERVHIYNVRLFDAGQQFLKSTVDFNNPNGVDGVTVEYSLFEYTKIGPAYGYTQGIDVHTGADWVIRYNVFRNITVPRTATYRQRPAIDLWSGSRNTLVYGNLILNCERGIILGVMQQPQFEHSHFGGAVFNNVIYRAAGATFNPDAGISIWDSPNTKVFNNTVIQNGTYPDAIEYRFTGTTNVQIYNNLTDAAIRSRDGAQATLANNYTQATAAFFVNPAAADLHLSAAATAAVDKGRSLTDFTVDFDGQLRPAGAAWDIGADERGGSAPTASAPRLYLPSNGQQNVTTTIPPSGTNGAYVRWYAFTGAVRYDVYLGTSSTPPKIGTVTPNGAGCSPYPCVSVAYPGTLYHSRPTTPNTTFYWRVVATTATGAAVSSPIWSFKTAP